MMEFSKTCWTEVSIGEERSDLSCESSDVVANTGRSKSAPSFLLQYHDHHAKCPTMMMTSSRAWRLVLRWLPIPHPFQTTAIDQ
jgi:hypothetical protein